MCYFRRILILRFWNVEILLNFDVAFCQCFTGPLMGEVIFFMGMQFRDYSTVKDFTAAKITRFTTVITGSSVSCT